MSAVCRLISMGKGAITADASFVDKYPKKAPHYRRVIPDSGWLPDRKVRVECNECA